MLIEALTLEGGGRFHERIALGPLHGGLNVLAQPDEWGKSTVVQAICRGLFDPYRAGGEEIVRMQPSGTTLSPGIEITFSVQGIRYRIMKRFLEGRMSELHRWSGREWQRTDEADRADE